MTLRPVARRDRTPGDHAAAHAVAGLALGVKVIP
jgi:hypothetical protein